MEVSERRTRARELRPGMIYEDYAFHPCLCTSVDRISGDVQGISLIDGSAPRTCDLYDSDVVLLSVAEVVAIRQDFEGYVLCRTAELELEDDASGS